MNCSVIRNILIVAPPRWPWRQQRALRKNLEPGRALSSTVSNWSTRSAATPMARQSYSSMPASFMAGGNPLLVEPALAESYRLIRYNRVGYGASSRPAGR